MLSNKLICIDMFTKNNNKKIRIIMNIRELNNKSMADDNWTSTQT